MKLFKLLAATALASGLASTALAQDVTVGVSWSNFQEERWKTDEAAIKAALEAAGAKYISADAQSSSAKQLSDVKSTLIKVLSGAYQADSGEIFISGEKADIRSPRDARRYNIETIYQTLALADNLDAASNLFLGRELVTGLGFVDDDSMEAETRKLMKRLNPNFAKFSSPVASDSRSPSPVRSTSTPGS